MPENRLIRLPRYGRNSLRPNPETALSRQGDFAYAQEVIKVGHFGPTWGASARVTNGLPAKGVSPGNLGDIPVIEERVKPYKNLRRPTQS